MIVNRKSVLVLIDSSVSTNFISARTARLLGIKMIPRREVTVQGMDDKPFRGKMGKINRETVSVKVEAALYPSARVQFSILETERLHVVLGMPWLESKIKLLKETLGQ